MRINPGLKHLFKFPLSAFTRRLPKLFLALEKPYKIVQGYRNSWTLDARVGRWTVDAGLRTLNTRLWTSTLLNLKLSKALETVDLYQ